VLKKFSVVVKETQIKFSWLGVGCGVVWKLIMVSAFSLSLSLSLRYLERDREREELENN